MIFGKPSGWVRRLLLSAGATSRRVVRHCVIRDGVSVYRLMDGKQVFDGMGALTRDTNYAVLSIGPLSWREEVSFVEYTRGKTVAFGQHLRVHDEWQGKGEGRRLLVDLEARLRKAGARSIEGGVFTHKVPFYKACGYEEIGFSYVKRTFDEV